MKKSKNQNFKLKSLFTGILIIGFIIAPGFVLAQLPGNDFGNTDSSGIPNNANRNRDADVIELETNLKSLEIKNEIDDRNRESINLYGDSRLNDGVDDSYDITKESDLNYEDKDVLYNITQGGIVPCGFFSPKSCGIKDLGQLFLNIINFLITIALISSSLVLALAGITYMTAGGNEGKIDKAHAMFKNFGIGLLLALTAFGIVQAIANSFGLSSEIWDIVNSFF